jgi:hypothetical protein
MVMPAQRGQAALADTALELRRQRACQALGGDGGFLRHNLAVFPGEAFMAPAGRCVGLDGGQGE